MKLEKSYITKKDYFGFEKHLSISCEYDPVLDLISDLFVTVYAQREREMIDITELFEHTPFAEIVDSIDWRELHAEALAEKEVARVS